jgi:hypothetical protein
VGSVAELPVELALESIAVVVGLGERGVRAWEGGLLQVERLDDLFLVELSDRFARHLLEDET